MGYRRGSFRHRVDLFARVHHPDDPNSDGLAARALNLSRSGIGLRLDVPLGWEEQTRIPRPDEDVRVAIYHQHKQIPLVRQWSGRVAHARSGRGGGQIGVRFGWPEGRGARSREAVPARSNAPDAIPDAPGQDVSKQSGWALSLAVALAGLGGDQAAKAWAAGLPAEARWAELWPGWLELVPAANHGTVAGLADGSPWTAPACGAACLALAALALRRPGIPRGQAETIGLGLLAAGLLGNASDRLALGYVRDFLATNGLPGWSFNLADLFLLAGAAGCLWASRAGAKQSAAGVSSTRSS